MSLFCAHCDCRAVWRICDTFGIVTPHRGSMTCPGRRRLRVRQLSILYGRISAICGKATTVYRPGWAMYPWCISQ